MECYRRAIKTKLAIVCLIGTLVFASFTVNVVSTDFPDYPVFTNTINFKDWFLQLVNDARVGVHNRLNSSDWFEYGWNFTSAHATQRWTRWNLAEYLWAVTVAYNITQNGYYLAEARWLLNNYLKWEGNNTASQPYTWYLYQSAPNANYAWLWHDSRIWLSMKFLSELGYDYDYSTRINWLMTKAFLNNATDLAWKYTYTTGGTYTDNDYVQNAFAPALVLLSYLHSKGVANYTDELQRIYASLEDFRLTNNQYKYKFTDTVASTRYTLITLLNILIARRLTPSIFNTTKIQQTLDSFSYANFDATGEEWDRNVGTAVAIAVVSQSGLTLPDAFKRLLRMFYDVSYNRYTERYSMDRQLGASRYYVDVWFNLVLFSLSWNWDKTYIFSTSPEVQQGGNYFFFNTQLSNTTYIQQADDGWFIYPMWQSNWVSSRFGVYPLRMNLNQIIFNATKNRWEAKTTHEGTVINLWWSKYLYDFYADSGTVKKPWRLVQMNSFETYNWRYIFSNGTITTEVGTFNGTLILDNVWALECRLSSTQLLWWIFKQNNSTFYQYRTGNTFYLSTSVSSWEGHFLYTFLTSHTTTDEGTARDLIIQSLKRLKQNDTLALQEADFGKTRGNIIHSDTNITSVTNTDSKLLVAVSGNEPTLGFATGSNISVSAYVNFTDVSNLKFSSNATQWGYRWNRNSRLVVFWGISNGDILFKIQTSTGILISGPVLEVKPGTG